MKSTVTSLGALVLLGTLTAANAQNQPSEPHTNGTMVGNNTLWGTIDSSVDFEVDNRMASGQWATPASTNTMVSRPFADYYGFELSQATSFNANVIEFDTARHDIEKFDVALFKYDSSDYLLPESSRYGVVHLIGEANDDSNDSLSLIARGSEIRFDTPQNLLGDGKYFLAVSGKVTGMDGGRYFGEAAFNSTAAIPEPGTWAMIVVGMGMVGFALTRQRRSQRES